MQGFIGTREVKFMRYSTGRFNLSRFYVIPALSSGIYLRNADSWGRLLGQEVQNFTFLLDWVVYEQGEQYRRENLEKYEIFQMIPPFHPSEDGRDATKDVSVSWKRFATRFAVPRKALVVSPLGSRVPCPVGSTCPRFQSSMTIFHHSSVAVIMVQDLSLDSPGRALIRGSCTRWILMLMRERSREDNTSTSTRWYALPHLYTLCVPYSVFCQVN